MLDATSPTTSTEDESFLAIDYRTSGLRLCPSILTDIYVSQMTHAAVILATLAIFVTNF